MDCYAYLFMIRNNSFNHLHRSQNIFHQFAVGMFAKVETERLLYIKNHREQLRVDSYIHLKHHINHYGQRRDIGYTCILPSSCTDSLRYIHEKIQDAMTYVRNYGKPDLFSHTLQIQSGKRFKMSFSLDKHQSAKSTGQCFA